MSRSHPRAEDAGQYYSGFTQPSGYSSLQQRLGNVIESTNVSPCQSGDNLSGSQARHHRLTFRDIRFEGARTGLSPLPLNAGDGHGTPLPSPDSMTGHQMCNQVSNNPGDISCGLQVTQTDEPTKTEPQSDEEEGAVSIDSGLDDDDMETKKTGAERLAEKRKMKRFRSASSISSRRTKN